MALHHIGIATSEIDTAARGAPIVEDRVWGIRSALRQVDDLQVEVVSPLDPGPQPCQAPAHEVINHVAFDYDDLEEGVREYLGLGWQVVQEPRPTALWGTRSAFLASPLALPRAFLVEIVESPRKAT